MTRLFLALPFVTVVILIILGLGAMLFKEI